VNGSEIKRNIAPVIAMLKHDIAKPSSPVLDKTFALTQLQYVLDLVNEETASVVESTDPRELLDLIQASLQRKD
jgi:hypothetical protein